MGKTRVEPRVVPLLAPARKVATSNGNGKHVTSSSKTNGTVNKPPHLSQPNSQIKPEDIPIAQELIEGHWLQKYITKQEPITSLDEVNKILGAVEDTISLEATTSLIVYDNGAMPASTNTESSYSENSWRRDNAIMILAMLQAASVGTEKGAELTEKANNLLIKMASFDDKPENRSRYTSFFFLDSNPIKNKQLAKEKFRKDINELPRQLASITEDGDLGDYHDWGHNQLDGLGVSLFSFFFAANTGNLNLKEIDNKLTKQNSENKSDSLFSVALHFLHEIEYWDQIDLGPWEKSRGYKRASSIGICLAAFKEAKKYFENHNWEPGLTITVNQNVDLKKIIDEGITKGTKVLYERIPEDGSFAIETNEIPNDSALAFLLLFNPGLNEAQENAISKVVHKLMGEYGIRRMDDKIDTFMGQNYAENLLGGGKWSELTPDHMAAQWSLFDPILAIYHYDKFIKSGGTDEDSFNLADRYLKRTLSQITKQDYKFDQYVNPFKKKEISVPAGTLPEARWRRIKDAREEWLPNSNSPLQMAHAAFAIMIAKLMKAIELKEAPEEQKCVA